MSEGDEKHRLWQQDAARWMAAEMCPGCHAPAIFRPWHGESRLYCLRCDRYWWALDGLIVRGCDAPGDSGSALVAMTWHGLLMKEWHPGRETLYHDSRARSRPRAW